MTPLLQTQQLTLGYAQGGAQTTLLRELNLHIQAGEFICLLGPNGAGKSTLIRSLCGLQPQLSGEVCIQGQAFDTLSPRERAKHISVVLTEQLPVGMMDARMLVSLGRHPYSGWFGRLSEQDRARIDWALESVGASGLAERQVSELSDGERQKVSIARGLAQEAKLMFLDEPTAFLDLPRRVELMALLRQLAHREQMGLLLSTHDLDLALRYADRIWILDQNTFTEGYPEALALEGQLASAFTSETLEWDVDRGIFQPKQGTCVDVFLEGDGAKAIWTRRALERLGYGICHSPDTCKFRIQLSESKWTVWAPSSTEEFTHLSDLIGWLQKYSCAHSA